MAKDLVLKVGRPQLKALSEACLAASSDSSRLRIACIDLIFNDTEIMMFATDSYMLIVRYLGQVEKKFPKEWRGFRRGYAADSVRKAALAAMKGIPRKVLGDVPFRISAETGELRIGSTIIDAYADPQGDKVRAKPIDFLDLVNGALSKIDGKQRMRPEKSFGVNHEFVARLGKAIGADQCGVRFDLPSRAIEPILVTAAAHPELYGFGFLMPVRLAEHYRVDVEVHRG